MPSYEGLYFLDLEKQSISGFVERLLPNGDYIVRPLTNKGTFAAISWNLSHKELDGYSYSTDLEGIQAIKARSLRLAEESKALLEEYFAKMEAEQRIAKALRKEKVDARKRKKATQ